MENNYKSEYNIKLTNKIQKLKFHKQKSNKN